MQVYIYTYIYKYSIEVIDWALASSDIDTSLTVFRGFTILQHTYVFHTRSRQIRLHPCLSVIHILSIGYTASSCRPIVGYTPLTVVIAGGYVFRQHIEPLHRPLLLPNSPLRSDKPTQYECWWFGVLQRRSTTVTSSHWDITRLWCEDQRQACLAYHTGMRYYKVRRLAFSSADLSADYGRTAWLLRENISCLEPQWVLSISLPELPS